MHPLLAVGLFREKSVRLLIFVVVCAVCARSMLAEVNEMSLDPVFPTPLMRMLNETVAASLRMQTENVSNSVSNTSLNDLYNDNDTQQMQIKYRTRKRQERLLLIQRDILQKLGLSKEPNVTSRLSDEERMRMIQMFDRTFDLQQDTPDSIREDTERSVPPEAAESVDSNH